MSKGRIILLVLVSLIIGVWLGSTTVELVNNNPDPPVHEFRKRDSTPVNMMNITPLIPLDDDHQVEDHFGNEQAFDHDEYEHEEVDPCA